MLEGAHGSGDVASPEPHIICTLYEGDYHFGVAALVNSLVAGGFEGPIVVGYRGSLPYWVKDLERVGVSDTFAVSGRAHLKFIPIVADTHFTHMKPAFMLSLIRDNPSARFISYFDPDITISCSWRFFETWVARGVALCEDTSNGTMPENHPLRLTWVELARASGWESPRPLSRYYNAGFVGLPVANAGFLRAWQGFIDLARDHGSNLESLSSGTRADPFHVPDQDALNIAAMYSTDPLTTMGPEGMGFEVGGFTMYHSVGRPKPWQKKLIWLALSGDPPSGCDRAFLDNAQSPISPYSRLALDAKRLSYKAAALIGRFYRRR
jgi:hypothetical protein